MAQTPSNSDVLRAVRKVSPTMCYPSPHFGDSESAGFRPKPMCGRLIIRFDDLRHATLLFPYNVYPRVMSLATSIKVFKETSSNDILKIALYSILLPPPSLQMDVTK
jgi:hypothetical protein